MKLNERKEEAVSPVIGIMLMLVVTIVIAAVITGFATDLSADTTKTPMALFEVQDINLMEVEEQDPVTWEWGYVKYLESFGLKHKGGDAVPLKYVQLTVEQIGGSDQNAIINVMTATEGKTRADGNYEDVYPLSIRGDSGNPANSAVTTGDMIQVQPIAKSGSLANIRAGATVKWTLSDIRTNAVIAKGEFVVGA